MADNQIITNADGTTRAANPDVWDHMTPEEQAAILAAWQRTWEGLTTSAAPPLRRGGVGIVIPRTSNDETPATAGWKQNPTEEELASFRANDWK